MQRFENKSVDDWNDHDKMTFALAGLTRVAATALKENLNPPFGWTDDYPERLESDLMHWIEEIRKLKIKEA